MQRFFTTNHLWLQTNDQQLWTLGLSQPVVEKMGQSVYVQFVEHKSLKPGDLFAVIESTKAANDIEISLALEEVSYNVELIDHPEWVYEDPYGKGWLLKGRASHFDSTMLMNDEQYKNFIKTA